MIEIAVDVESFVVGLSVWIVVSVREVHLSENFRIPFASFSSDQYAFHAA